MTIKRRYVRKKTKKYPQETIDKIITLIHSNTSTTDISILLDVPKPIINYYRLQQQWATQKKRSKRGLT